MSIKTNQKTPSPALPLSLSSAILCLIEPHHEPATVVVIQVDADQVEERVALRLCDFGNGLQIGADAERAALQKPHPAFLFEYLRARLTLHFVGIICLRQILGL